MYDEILKQDLIRFKSTDNINELEESNILKIIKNRTKDKLFLLNMLLTKNMINTECYKELYNRIQQDLKLSFLYLIGICNI